MKIGVSPSYYMLFSVLVEVASALLEKHRIFCVSLDRLFVTLERGAVLVQAYKFDSISAKDAFMTEWSC